MNARTFKTIVFTFLYYNVTKLLNIVKTISSINIHNRYTLKMHIDV